MVDGLRVRRLAVGVLAWVVFALGWWVAARGGTHDAFAGTSVLGLSGLGALVVTRAWQAHNKAIHRRRGARRSSRRPEQAWQSDRLGRQLHLGDGLAAATEVVVSTRAGVKHYEATS